MTFFWGVDKIYFWEYLHSQMLRMTSDLTTTIFSSGHLLNLPYGKFTDATLLCFCVLRKIAPPTPSITYGFILRQMKAGCTRRRQYQIYFIDFSIFSFFILIIKINIFKNWKKRIRRSKIFVAYHVIGFFWWRYFI